MSAYADTHTVGYRGKFYQIHTNTGELCERQFNLKKNWCVMVSPSAIGLHMVYNQLFITSKSDIYSVDIIRKKIKWNIPLHKMHKVLFHYPVIVTLSKDHVLSGYDFFSGYPLWKKNTHYTGLFETNGSVWVKTSRGIEQLDVVSSNTSNPIALDHPVQYLAGDDVFLFLQFDNGLVHYNRLNNQKVPMGTGFRILDIAADYVLVGNDDFQQLRSFSNHVISDNIQEALFKVHSQHNVVFAYVKNNEMALIDVKGSVFYNFTPTQNKVKMGYNYKLNNKLRGFYGNQQLWTLKQINTQLSDHDT